MQPTKPDPTGNPFPPPPPPQPCAEAPVVKTEPMYTIEDMQDFGRSCSEYEASKSAQEIANLKSGDERDESVIAKLRVYQDLAHRAAQIIKHDTRNPQVEKWFEDYEATL